MIIINTRPQGKRVRSGNGFGRQFVARHLVYRRSADLDLNLQSLPLNYGD